MLAAPSGSDRQDHSSQRRGQQEAPLHLAGDVSRQTVLTPRILPRGSVRGIAFRSGQKTGNNETKYGRIFLRFFFLFFFSRSVQQGFFQHELLRDHCELGIA